MLKYSNKIAEIDENIRYMHIIVKRVIILKYLL